MNAFPDLFPGFAEHRIETDGAEIFVRAIRGKYTVIEPGEKCHFNPLQLPYTPENRTFLAEWLRTMVTVHDEPFTAEDMEKCNFLNKVVPREELEAETAKYALACARNRPVDTVYMQKVFFEIYKQHQGEYMGSLLSAFFESMGSGVAADGADDLDMMESIDSGLAAAVNDNDDKFPPEFRLSKKNRKKKK